MLQTRTAGDDFSSTTSPIYYSMYRIWRSFRTAADTKQFGRSRRKLEFTHDTIDRLLTDSNDEDDSQRSKNTSSTSEWMEDDDELVDLFDRSAVTNKVRTTIIATTDATSTTTTIDNHETALVITDLDVKNGGAKRKAHADNDDFEKKKLKIATNNDNLEYTDVSKLYRSGDIGIHCDVTICQQSNHR